MGLMWVLDYNWYWWQTLSCISSLPGSGLTWIWCSHRWSCANLPKVLDNAEQGIQKDHHVRSWRHNAIGVAAQYRQVLRGITWIYNYLQAPQAGSSQHSQVDNSQDVSQIPRSRRPGWIAVYISCMFQNVIYGVFLSNIKVPRLFTL